LEETRQLALAVARDAPLRIRIESAATRGAAEADRTSTTRLASNHDVRLPMPGGLLAKEHKGETHVVKVLDDGFDYDGRLYRSLSAIAQEIIGTKWNGYLFFGIAKEVHMAAANKLRPMLTAIRCAIYTRKSTDEGLDSDFNTLNAQRESAEAFIASQRHEGWLALPEKYDDGGFTGANMERPAMKRLLDDVRNGLVNCVVVCKVDCLTRSLLDFARIMEVLDKHGTTFVSVTQQFNTTASLGRLTLNILLSFAQFERSNGSTGPASRKTERRFRRRARTGLVNSADRGLSIPCPACDERDPGC
jgi:DNA invertase Pin-like site-specific DNA recombinase